MALRDLKSSLRVFSKRVSKSYRWHSGKTSRKGDGNLPRAEEVGLLLSQWGNFMALRQSNAVALNQRGAGLVEVMTAVALLGIGLSASTSHFGSIKETQEFDAGLLSLNKTASVISQVASSPGAVKYSAGKPGNHDLQKCVSKNGSCAQITDPGNAIGFSLYLPDRKDAIAGPVSKPALFDSRGEPCTGQRCAFQATISYLAICPNNAATCTRAQTMLFRYRVEPILREDVANDDSRVVWRHPALWRQANGQKRILTGTSQIDFNLSAIWDTLDLDCNSGLVNYNNIGGMTVYPTPKALQAISFSFDKVCTDLTAPSAALAPPGVGYGPQGPKGPRGDPGPMGKLSQNCGHPRNQLHGPTRDCQGTPGN